MNRQRMKTVLALVVCLTPSVCLAWGRDGHRIVANIAERYLTPQAAAAVKDLLGEQTLADVSTWPDEIRRERKHTAPWHYANPAPGSDGFNLKRDCPEKGCVVSAIIKFSHVLRDKKAPRQERIEALKFIVHFVGDIHQPLHLGRARDKGGNDIKVTFFENSMNLHSLWDSGMIRRAKGNKTWQEYAADIEDGGLKDFAKKHGVKENITEEEMDQIIMQRVARLATLNPVAWANESHKLAHSNAYDVPKDGRIGQEYFQKNISIVNERLSVAGYRLALLLNFILDETTKEAMEECGQDFDSWFESNVGAR